MRRSDLNGLSIEVVGLGRLLGLVVDRRSVVGGCGCWCSIVVVIVVGDTGAGCARGWSARVGVHAMAVWPEDAADGVVDNGVGSPGGHSTGHATRDVGANTWPTAARATAVRDHVDRVRRRLAIGRRMIHPRRWWMIYSRRRRMVYPRCGWVVGCSNWLMVPTACWRMVNPTVAHRMIATTRWRAVPTASW